MLKHPEPDIQAAFAILEGQRDELIVKTITLAKENAELTQQIETMRELIAIKAEDKK